MRESLKRIVSKPLSLAFIVIFSVVVIFLVYSGNLHKNLKEEIITTLRETSHQTAMALRNQISGDRRAIEDVAMMISKDGYTSEDVMNSLNKVVSNHHLLRMGIVNGDGSVISTDGKIHSLPDRLYIKAAFKGESSVSERLSDVVDGGTIIVYGAPIYDKTWNKVEATLFGTFSITQYDEALSTNLFSGKGCSYVVKKDGGAISSSNNAYTEFTDILQCLKDMDPSNAEVAERLKDSLLNGEEGSLEFLSKDENGKLVKKYMYYIPLDINDWYLLSTVPTDVLDGKMLSSLAATGILGAIIIAICAIILLILLRNQQRAKDALEQIVYVDKVTGNSSYEKFKLDALSILEKNQGNSRYALVSVDIDKFKYINDMFGYAEGDSLICYIDNVFLNNCGNDELAAHIAADDFILLLKYDTKENLCKRLELLNSYIEEYKRPAGRNYKVLISIGVYEIAANVTDIDTMKDRAEIPRKQVKRDKSALYAFYDESVREKILRDRELENNMSAALRHGEFVVLYQPKFLVHDKSLAGAEALVRWRKDDGTLIEPGSFIPLFEENGFIVSLDEYVFTQVCRDIKRWQEEGYEVMPISSNLSRKNIAIEDLAAVYEAIVDKFGIPKELVALELTETAFVENDSVIGDFVMKMNSKGFSISMDDFGTGLSSLGQLLRIDISTLKLDRSLVRDIDSNHKSRAIVDVCINLMHQWDVGVTAEGVETIEQFEYLKELQCDEVQGYYFARPMARAEYEKLLKRRGA